MLKKPKILVIGSFVMDLIATTSRAPKSGETVVGLKFQTAPGGKGANQAVQCARLGADVTMVGRVGSDMFGSLLIDTAAKAGVDVSHVCVDSNESSGVGHITLEVTEHAAQNRITVCPGANFTMSVDDIAWLKDEVGKYDMMMLQFEIPMHVNEMAARIAHDAGVPVMVNPAPAAPISEELMTCTTFLSPNEHEAALISDHDLRVEADGINEEDLKEVTKIFTSKGVENLIITLGENGSIASCNNGIDHTDCVYMPHVVDPTAAGDSFVAAFCTGFCAGMSKKQALAFASHTAAITVSRMGAMPSLPTILEVKALLEERNYKGLDLDELNVLIGD